LSLSQLPAGTGVEFVIIAKPNRKGRDYPMRKLVVGVVSAVLLGAASLSSAAPALAQSHGHSRDYYVTRFCDANPGARDCRDWNRGHRHWSHRQYRDFYSSHRSAFPAFVGGLFGFALGAAAASAANNNDNVVTYGSAHVRACEQRYRSYDARTDSYMGYDGYRHRCTL
jgi:hypothetical protein